MREHSSNRNKYWNIRNQIAREADAFNAFSTRKELIICLSRTIKILRRKAHFKNLRDWKQSVCMR
jgi:hypothetical protein